MFVDCFFFIQLKSSLYISLDSLNELLDGCCQYDLTIWFEEFGLLKAEKFNSILNVKLSIKLNFILGKTPYLQRKKLSLSRTPCNHFMLGEYNSWLKFLLLSFIAHLCSDIYKGFSFHLRDTFSHLYWNNIVVYKSQNITIRR